VPVHGKVTYLPPILELTLEYNQFRNGAGGDSRGMLKYLKNDLAQVASSRPWLLFTVKSRNGPPIIKAKYTDNRIITMNVSRMNASDIKKSINDLVDSRGLPVKPTNVSKSHIFTKSVHWHPFLASNQFRP
jgi:hypothetical protein